jgi:HEAT repeat protein
LRRVALLCFALAACAPRSMPPPMAVPSAAPEITSMPAPLDLLEAAAADEEPWVRGRGLAALVGIDPRPAGGVWGPRGLWDPDPWVRRQVLRSLATRMDEPETRALLAGHVRQPSAPAAIRAAAAMALHRAGHLEVDGELAAMAAGATGWDRLPLSLAAAQAGDAASIARLVDRLLPSGDFPLDLGLVEDLAHSAVPELAVGLVAGLDLAEEEAELMMAVALVGLGHPEGARRVDAAAASGGLRGLEAIDLLALCPASAAEPSLRKARRAADVDVRRMADLLALRHGWAKPEVALAILEEGAPPELEALALAALAPRPPARAPRPARKIARDRLADVDPRVREAAARLLGRVGRPVDAGLLEANLVDESAIVRIVAAEALLSLRPRNGDPVGGGG